MVLTDDDTNTMGFQPAIEHPRLSLSIFAASYKDVDAGPSPGMTV
jgi:hypothetical protein